MICQTCNQQCGSNNSHNFPTAFFSFCFLFFFLFESPCACTCVLYKRLHDCKGMVKMFFGSCFPSTSVTPEILISSLGSLSPPPLSFFLMYHCFFIFLFTKRIMLFVLSTVRQSLLQHWKAISLYETFTMYLLWLTFDSSLLFTCTLGVIIEVNLFYTNTKGLLW